MNCLFIYNPASGKGKINRYVSYVKEELAKKFDSVDVKASEKAGDLTAFAKAACGVYDTLVFSGGDGTFNEVLQGVGGEEVRPILGYIPTGTCNDIARTYGIPFRVKKAVKTIVNGVPREVDSFRVNDRYAEYVVCTGAFTQATYNTKQTAKKKYGKLAYFYDGVRKYLVPPVFRVSLKSASAEIETDSNFITLINSKSVAGIPLNRKAVLDDGLVDVLIVKLMPERKKRGRVRAFFKVIKIFLFGMGKMLLQDSEIVKIRDSHFEISVPGDVEWNYDGERGASGNITVDVLKKHIRLLMPEKTVKKFEKRKKLENSEK